MPVEVAALKLDISRDTGAQDDTDPTGNRVLGTVER